MHGCCLSKSAMVFFYPSKRLLQLSRYYAAPFGKPNFPAVSPASLLESSSAAQHKIFPILRRHQQTDPEHQQLPNLSDDMAGSKIRINFHSTSEAMINKQINMELHASYVYMSMVSQQLGYTILVAFMDAMSFAGRLL